MRWLLAVSLIATFALSLASPWSSGRDNLVLPSPAQAGLVDHSSSFIAAVQYRKPSNVELFEVLLADGSYWRIDTVTGGSLSQQAVPFGAWPIPVSDMRNWSPRWIIAENGDVWRGTEPDGWVLLGSIPQTPVSGGSETVGDLKSNY